MDNNIFEKDEGGVSNFLSLPIASSVTLASARR
jgi:hypothetical protein